MNVDERISFKLLTEDDHFFEQLKNLKFTTFEDGRKRTLIYFT